MYFFFNLARKNYQFQQDAKTIKSSTKQTIRAFLNSLVDPLKFGSKMSVSMIFSF